MPDIDVKKIVMDFDYQKFAKGAMDAIQILEKIDKTINFKGKTTGFDKIAKSVDAATASVRTSSPEILSAIDAINKKFSTVGIIGQEVTRRITNSAMDMLQGLTSGIDGVMNQIKTGGSSRALNLEQARFMLKGLTGDLGKVEDIISGPVNDAVTGTRFGLDAAAVAAANLYASGITGSEELTKSLQAISGAATMTNRDYGEMADIFSTVKSNGKLMTMQLRQFSAMGMNVSAELAKSLGKSEQQINEMVTQGQISYEQFADVMYKYWDLAADANSTFAGSLSNVNAQLSKIGEVVASQYYKSMIAVNNSLIVFIKAVKNELGPAYEVINNVIDKATKALAKFIADERTLKTVTNIVKGLSNVMRGLEPAVKAVGKAFKAAFPGDLLDSLVKTTSQFKKTTKTFKEYMNLGVDKKTQKVLKIRNQESKQLHKIVKDYGLFNDKAIEKAEVSEKEMKLLQKNLGLTKDTMNLSHKNLKLYKEETQKQRDKLNAQRSQSKRIHEIVERYGLANEKISKHIVLTSKEQKLIQKALGLRRNQNGEIVKSLNNFDKENHKLALQIKHRDAVSKRMRSIIKEYDLMNSAKTKDIKLSEKDQKFVEKTLGVDAKHLSSMKKKLQAYDATTKALKKQNKEQTKADRNASGAKSLQNTVSEVLERVKWITEIGKNLTSLGKLFVYTFQQIGYAVSPVLVPLKGFIDLFLRLAKVASKYISYLVDSFIRLGALEDWANKVHEWLSEMLPDEDEMGKWVDKTVDKFHKALPLFGQIVEAFGKVKQAFDTITNGIKEFVRRVFGINSIFEAFTKVLMGLTKFKLSALEPIISTFEAVMDSLYWSGGVRSELDFPTIIENMIANVSEAADHFVSVVKDIAGRIRDAIVGFFKMINVDFFDSAVNLSKILDVVAGALAVFFAKKNLSGFDIIYEKFQGINHLMDTVQDFAGKAGKVLDSISGAFNEFTKTLKIGQLMMAAIAVGFLAAALVTMQKVDAERVSMSVAALSSLMIMLTGCLSVLKATTQTGQGLTSMAMGFVIMAEGVKILAKALVVVSQLDPKEMANGLTGVGVLIAMLVKMAQSLSGKDISPKSMMAVVIYVMAVKMMVSALKKVTAMVSNDLESTVIAFAVLEALIWSMFGFVAALNAISPKLGMSAPIALSAYMAVIEEMVLVLIALMALVAVDQVSKFPHLALAFVALEALMWSLFGFVAALNAIAPNLSIKTAVLVGLYVKELAFVIGYLGILRSMVKDDWKATGLAFLLLEGLMWSMLGFVKAIDVVSNSKGNTLKGIGGILAVTSAVGRLATAFSSVRDKVGDTSAAGLAATALAFGIIEALVWSMVGVLVVLKKTQVQMSWKPEMAIFTLEAFIKLVVDGLIKAFKDMKKAVGTDLASAAVALGILEALIWSMFGFLAALKGLDKALPGDPVGAIASLVAISISLNILVGAFTKLSKGIKGMGLGDIAAALLLFEAILWSMVGVLAVMSTITANPMAIAGVAAAAGSLLLLAGALSLIVPGVVALAKVGPMAFVGAAALAAILGVFVGFGAIVGNFPQIALGLLSISAAIAAFGLSLAALGFGIGMLGAGVLKAVTSIYALGKVITSLTPDIIANIQTGLPILLKTIEIILKQLLAMIAGLIPEIVTLAVQMVVSFVKGISDNIGDIVHAAVDLVVNFCTALEEEMDRIVDTAFKLIISFIDGLANAIDENGPKLKKAIMHLIESIVGFIIGKKNANKFFKAAKKLISGFVKGVKKWWADTKQAVSDFFDKLKAAWDKWTDPETYKQIAHDLIDGFVKGIKQKVDDAVNGIKNFGNKIIGGLKGILGIASPSKVFRQLAIFTVEGFMKGIDYKSKDAVKQIKKFGKTIAKEMKAATDISSSASIEAEAKLTRQLNKETKNLKKLNSQRKDAKEYVKAYNSELKQVYYNMKSNRKLSTENQAELKFLQNELYRTGKLSDAQMRKMGRLLGLTKSETKELNKSLSERQKYQKQYDKITKTYKQQAALVSMINKQLKNDPNGQNKADLYKYQQRWAEGLANLGKALYKNTDEYKQNKKAIEANKSAITELRKEKVKQTKAIQEDKKTIQTYNYALSGHYAVMKGVKGLTTAQKKELESLQAKMKSGQQLTAHEITLLGKYLGLSKDQILILKETNQNGIAQLAYMKSKAKLSKEESKTLSELQEKMRKGKTLTDEEITNLGKLLGLSKAQMKQLKVELGVRKDYNDKLTQDKDTLKQLNQTIKDCRQNNKDLTQAIKDGAVPALTDFYNTIKSNLENALNPFNTALSDSIDLFSKFAATAVDVSLDKFVKIKDEDYDKRQALIEQLSGRNINSAIMTQLKESDLDTLTQWASLTDAEIANINHKFNMGLVENIDSFGSAYDEWRAKFAELEAKGFNQAIIDRVRALGPAGLEIVKQYLGFTEEEINAANAAIVHSTNATFDEWLETNKQKIAQQEKFLADLNAARELYGLSDEAYRAFLEQGYDAAGAIVEGMLTGTSEAEIKKKVDETSSIFSSKNDTIERLATESVQGAAASMAGAGSKLFTEFFNGFTNGYMMDEEKYKAGSAAIKKMVKTILKQSQKVSEETSQQAGTQTGTVYIDGMSYAIDDNGYLVTDAASDVAEDAKKGTEQYLSKSNGEYIGKQMDDGLVAGLTDPEKSNAVKDAAVAVAYQAYAAAMAALAIASPSKKFAEIGKYADLGFAKGLKDYAGAVVAATEGVAAGSLDSMREALSGISDELTNADNTPVIKPILDLSNVSRGAIEMKRMFDATHVAASMTSEGEAGADADETKSGSNYTFVQNNYSPKALSRIDIYRQTKNQFAMLKGATS